MKLQDLDTKNWAPRALKETYQVDFDASSLSMIDAKKMLQKVRTLANEARSANDFYEKQTSPTYMKLVFMEQALVEHYNVLASRPKARIVIENEEVEKSQVVLAAQDMVDSVQKMVEDVSDMLVKELPALVDSVQSEIGANESETFNSQVSEALSSLTAALTQSKTTLQSALNSITGQGDASGFDTDADLGGDDLGMGDDMGGDDLGMGDDMGADLGADAEAGADEFDAPPTPPLGGAGREKR